MILSMGHLKAYQGSTKGLPRVYQGSTKGLPRVYYRSTVCQIATQTLTLQLEIVAELERKSG